MERGSRIRVVLVVVGMALAAPVLAGDPYVLTREPPPSQESNPLGVYLGAGIGEATVRSDYGFDPYNPVDSHPPHTAWKVLVGLRPIPFLGAEAEYLDFGHPSGADGYYNAQYGFYDSADSHPKAAILYGVGYLPLPFLDVFAKAGGARLETNIRVNDYARCLPPAPGVMCGPPVLPRRGVSRTRVAYGAGAQAHFHRVALRGEYERISSTFGDPDAFMLSATWTF